MILTARIFTIVLREGSARFDYGYMPLPGGLETRGTGGANPTQPDCDPHLTTASESRISSSSLAVLGRGTFRCYSTAIRGPSRPRLAVECWFASSAPSCIASNCFLSTQTYAWGWCALRLFSSLLELKPHRAMQPYDQIRVPRRITRSMRLLASIPLARS